MIRRIEGLNVEIPIMQQPKRSSFHFVLIVVMTILQIFAKKRISKLNNKKLNLLQSIVLRPPLGSIHIGHFNKAEKHSANTEL